jgi:hypothetical protein
LLEIEGAFGVIDLDAEVSQLLSNQDVVFRVQPPFFDCPKDVVAGEVSSSPVVVVSQAPNDFCNQRAFFRGFFDWRRHAAPIISEASASPPHVHISNFA